MSRVSKRVHYDAVYQTPGSSGAAPAGATPDGGVRLLAWSDFRAGYVPCHAPPQPYLILKLKGGAATAGAASPTAAAVTSQWEPFVEAVYSLAPATFAAYMLDATAIGTPQHDVEEATTSGGLGVQSRAVQRTLLKLNPSRGTVIAAGVAGSVALKLAAMPTPGFDQVLDRLVLLLPRPTDLDATLLRTLRTCAAALTLSKTQKVRELLIVSNTEAERRTWLESEALLPVRQLFTTVRCELLPPSGQPLRRLAEILVLGSAVAAGQKAPAPSVPRPASRFDPQPGAAVAARLFEIRFVLSRYTKMVEQVVNLADEVADDEGEDEEGEEEVEEADETEAQPAAAPPAPAAAAAAAPVAPAAEPVAVKKRVTIELPEAAYEQVGQRAPSTGSANTAGGVTSGATTAVVKPAAPVAATAGPVETPVASIHIPDLAFGRVVRQCRVRISGTVMDANGTITNAHGTMRVEPAAPLKPFVGKAVTFTATPSCDIDGRVMLAQPTAIVRVPAPQQRDALIVKHVPKAPSAMHSEPARYYGCVLVRGRKVALVRDGPTDPHLRFPCAPRRNADRSGIDVAIQCLCDTLDVTPDNFFLPTDVAPVVFYQNGGDRVVTLYIAVPTEAAAGGVARDAVEEALTPDDRYDWVTAAQAAALLQTDAERDALADTERQIRRAVAAKRLAWPEGHGIIGDAAKKVNDTVVVLVQCPLHADEGAGLLDAGVEYVHKSLQASCSASTSLGVVRPAASWSNVNFDETAMAKAITKAGHAVTIVPVPSAASLEALTLELGPAIRKRTWAEVRVVSVMSSDRAAAAFDPTVLDDENEGGLALAPALEHSDLFVLAPPAASASTDANTAYAAALLAARLSCAGAGAAVALRTDDAIDVAATVGTLCPWMGERPTREATTARFTHPAVLVWSSAAAAAEANGGDEFATELPVNPAILSQVANSESGSAALAELRIVQVGGTMAVAGYNDGPVEVRTTGSSLTFAPSESPFRDGIPQSDVTIVCALKRSTDASASASPAAASDWLEAQRRSHGQMLGAFWTSLLCATDAEAGEADGCALMELPGWEDAHHAHDDDEDVDEEQ